MRAILAMTAIGLSAASAGPLQAAAPPNFTKDIQPFLAKYCVECHNAKKAKAGLNLETHAGLMKGTKKGAVVVPSQLGQSKLLQTMLGQGKAMPPKKYGKQPTPVEIATIREWIATGAKGEALAATKEGSGKPKGEAREKGKKRGDDTKGTNRQKQREDDGDDDDDEGEGRKRKKKQHKEDDDISRSSYSGWPLDAWLKDMSRKDQIVRRKAYVLLASLKSEALPEAILALRSDDPAVRYGGAWLVGHNLKQAGKVAPALLPLLDDKDASVRRMAFIGLARLGAAGAPAAAAALRDRDRPLNVRRGAAYLLGRSGDRSRSTRASLSQALQDSDARVRQLAAASLRQMNPAVLGEHLARGRIGWGEDGGFGFGGEGRFEGRFRFGGERGFEGRRFFGRGDD